MKRASYAQARFLLFLLGAAASASLTVLAYSRGAGSTEVVAPALYVVVFAGAIFWGMPGGLGGASLASLVYVTLVTDQLSAIGLTNFSLLVVTRVLTYFFYGVIVAVGIRTIEQRLRKLELYDQIDDATGLFNSQFLLQDLQLETSRADRYRTFFSVAVLDVHAAAIRVLSGRKQARAINELASMINDAVRTVDRVAFLSQPEKRRFVIVLPETQASGARIFADRLDEQARNFLFTRGAATDNATTVTVMTYPDDPAAIQLLRDEVATADADRRTIRAD